MSLRILKPGILDSFQDGGRFGYQQLGINPGGAIDTIAMKIANALAGNNNNEALLEMHFPAPEILFDEDVVIAISGADFTPTILGKALPVNQPIVIRRGSALTFLKVKHGARSYISIQGGFTLDTWLGSKSTNQQVNAGGYSGRALKMNDVIGFRNSSSYQHILKDQPFFTLPFSANIQDLYNKSAMRFLPGRQHHLLTDESRRQLLNEPFQISNQSNRMGYRLQGKPLELKQQVNLISLAVTKGTVQLLPDGQLIVLMADHQTTGGYPVVGNVISADVPTLAQKKPGDTIMFRSTDLATAENLLSVQHLHLQQLQNACTLRLYEFL